MSIPKRTAPRHRRPDNEKADPKSDYYVPNDPEVRAKKRVSQPRHEVRRKTRIETDQADTEEDLAWHMRLAKADEQRLPPPEPTECPLCGLTPLQALATHQPPAVIVSPGKVRCSCSPEVIDVGELLRQQRGEMSQRTREILECWREQQTIEHEPGSESKGKTRERPLASEARAEQDWHGFAEVDRAEVERQEKLVVTIKGKIPRLLRNRLKAEAALLGKHKESLLFRWLLSRNLTQIETAYEVESGGDNVMVEVMVNRQWADLWAAVKTGLAKREQRPVSSADLMASVMLREWA